MMVIVGVGRSGGQFVDKATGQNVVYDNIFVYVESGENDTPDRGMELVGKMAREYKIKAADFFDCFGCQSLAEVKGLDVVPYYDRYGEQNGRVKGFQVRRKR